VVVRVSEILGVDSRVLYTLLIGVVVLERLVELFVSDRNTRRLKSQGAVEVGSGHYPIMVVMHTLFLISAPLEVWLLSRPLIPALAISMLAVLLAAMALRYWVIVTLRGRWTTRVICLPGSPLIATGPYRYLKHPNYLAVVAETFSLPMVHTAWLTAIVFTVCNAALLRVRIRVEDRALWRYGAYFDDGQGESPSEIWT
jgi:methyltransferase